MKSKGHLIFCLFLVVVSSYVIFSASRWSFKTGFFPLAVAIPLLILVLAHLLLESFGGSEKASGPAVEAEFSQEVTTAVAQWRVVTLFSWIAAFILMVFLLGFPLAVPLFILCYLRLQSRVSLWQSVGLTVVAWGSFYMVFQRLIRLQFEEGLVQSWLGL